MILDLRENTQIDSTKAPLVFPMLGQEDYFSRHSACMQYFKLDGPKKTEKGQKRAYRKALCRPWPQGAGFPWAYVETLETIAELDDAMYAFISGKLSPALNLFRPDLPSPTYHHPIKLTPKQSWSMRRQVIRWIVGKGYQIHVLRDPSTGPNGICLNIMDGERRVIHLGMMPDGSTHS
jgi:hypothetical protein